MFRITHLVLVTLGLFSTAHAQHETMCVDGSASCSLATWGINGTAAGESGAIAALGDVIQLRIDDLGGELNATDTKYEANQKVACSISTNDQAICAFYSGKNYDTKYNIVDARNALYQLKNSGCVVCGEVRLHGTGGGQLETGYFDLTEDECAGATSTNASNFAVTC